MRYKAFEELTIAGCTAPAPFGEIVVRLRCNRPTVDLQASHDYPLNRPTVAPQSWDDGN